MHSDMQIEIIPALEAEQKEAAVRLFSEYTDMLAAHDPSVRNYLAIQNYEDELLHLDKKIRAAPRQTLSGILRRRARRMYCPPKAVGRGLRDEALLRASRVSRKTPGPEAHRKTGGKRAGNRLLPHASGYAALSGACGLPLPELWILRDPLLQ